MHYLKIYKKQFQIKSLIILKVTILLLLIFLASCINDIEKKGYSFELSDYKLVKDGISNKQSVINFMGSPTFISNFEGEELWVYFSEDIRRILFFKPKILDRKIMVISFDKTDIVDRISNYSLNDEENIRFTADYTEVKSHQKGFWLRIFKNIGQVRAN